ncbi:MAG: hypothetical protein CO093_00840, partial [Alphaproteobacteria bacterium CG_4_9_14_3_um_filter_47_13]
NLRNGGIIVETGFHLKNAANLSNKVGPPLPAVTALATEAQKNTQDKAIALDTTNMKSILTTFAPK